MGKKVSGKRGFYRVKGHTDLFYRHYAHDAKTNWEHNEFKGLVLPDAGEVIIYSRKDKEYLIVKAIPSMLIEIGKQIRGSMYLTDLIDKLFEKQILNYSIAWSRLDEKDLDKSNSVNWPMLRMTWV